MIINTVLQILRSTETEFIPTVDRAKGGGGKKRRGVHKKYLVFTEEGAEEVLLLKIPIVIVPSRIWKLLIMVVDRR